MNDPKQTLHASLSHKVHPAGDTNAPPDYAASTTETDAPPPYVPYQPSQVQPPMMGNNMMSMGVSFNPQQVPEQWLTPGVTGALGLLDDVEEVTLLQEMSIINAMTGFAGGISKKFKVSNPNKAVMFVLEENPAEVSSAQNFRAFDFTAKDCHGQAAFRVVRGSRPCSYCCFCFACCDCCQADADVIENGIVIGQIRQKCSFSRPVYKLLDGDDRDLLNVTGESALCTPARRFTLEKSDGTDGDGFIAKHGFGMITLVNEYTIKFPKDVDARFKASCIGLTLLFNFRFHSNTRRSRGRRR